MCRVGFRAAKRSNWVIHKTSDVHAGATAGAVGAHISILTSCLLETRSVPAKLLVTARPRVGANRQARSEAHQVILHRPRAQQHARCPLSISSAETSTTFSLLSTHCNPRAHTPCVYK
jgi:hypothetical protein